ncbi:Qat anti-phage system TatD family nuclease QatD [Sphingomonas sp. NPDC079357]|uniref:Qat anti-phage system TatD family nuclease QatD n=1 Tax=Sphingomonas sp. NPDC079357 TaxID=3364518 RepID=UPI00384FF8E8
MIDFHCHLDLYPDPHGVARACAESGLYVLSVTTTPSAWSGTAALAQGAPRIRTALGLHPQIAHQRKGEVQLFERLIGETRYVGEIGLDGAPEFKRHWEDQTFVFGRVLDICSAAGGRVLSLHSRRAATPVLDAIEARPGVGTPILHWFSGTHRELARAVDLGCWFSVGPAMLRSDKGRELAKRMPRDRLLTESDGPFAQVAGRAMWPWEGAGALTELSGIWGEPTTDVERRLEGNLARLGREAGANGV